jgi:hypothetical protein
VKLIDLNIFQVTSAQYVAIPSQMQLLCRIVGINFADRVLTKHLLIRKNARFVKKCTESPEGASRLEQ